MSRLHIPEREALSAEQRQALDEIVAGRRGRAGGPLLVWLKSPELARRAQRLGEFARYETSFPPRLSELAILVTARFWTAQYEWYAHKKEALKGGLDPAVIDAIAARRRPEFKNDDERVVYDVATALHETHGVPDDLYRNAVNAFGEQAMVELVGLLGYYSLVSMTLNAFEVGLPEGETPELAP